MSLLLLLALLGLNAIAFLLETRAARKWAPIRRSSRVTNLGEVTTFNAFEGKSSIELTHQGEAIQLGISSTITVESDAF